jgi:hypothetical protein
MTETAHLVQMFDSTVVRAYVSAAGAKGAKRSDRVCADIRDGREQLLPSKGRIQMSKTNYLQTVISDLSIQMCHEQTWPLPFEWSKK